MKRASPPPAISPASSIQLPLISPMPFPQESCSSMDHLRRTTTATISAQPPRPHCIKAWSRYGSAIAPNRSLRDWLRLDFFKDVHKGMYENRPIHWPLSSSEAKPLWPG
jgi:hypothetical protein